MNVIFDGQIARDEVVYDYVGIWTRRSGGLDWKAVVRNTGVVSRPSGTLDDALNDDQVREVIRELVDDSIAGADSASTGIRPV